MSAASDLIERMERETGQRIDSNGGDNMAAAGLLGAMARLMGDTPQPDKGGQRMTRLRIYTDAGAASFHLPEAQVRAATAAMLTAARSQYITIHKLNSTCWDLWAEGEFVALIKHEFSSYNEEEVT